jgi:hypothetical protein
MPAYFALNGRPDRGNAPLARSRGLLIEARPFQIHLEVRDRRHPPPGLVPLTG